ncbi:MAG: hypothetical protein CSA49_05360 [Gammaproteobacteria bacterium]|nr:MAG: hypothetical protein CSA49_05360 [Gammaproteobacteria bacterium]
MKASKGFTLVELIAVIIILGILSRFALGLFSAVESVEANIVKNQLLASLRSAQQLALSRQNLTATGSVALNVHLVSGNWVFSTTYHDAASPGAATFDVAEIERGNTTLRYSESNFSAACSALPVVTSLNVEFDGDGNLINGNRLRICIVGEQTINLCVSASGFAYEGATCL